MKSLLEIYWNIDHKCNEESISLNDESILLHQAAEEYFENLLKHEQWKAILKSDIEYLEASAQMRREQRGYSFGANMFLGFITKELERYGLSIDEIKNPSVQGNSQTGVIPETGNNDDVYYEIFDGVEEKYINKYKKSFNYDEDKYTSFFAECKGKTPFEIAEMLYNCKDFYNCRAIKAVYFVCVVPTMTDDNYIIYETFLNHYKSIDNAQG